MKKWKNISPLRNVWDLKGRATDEKFGCPILDKYKLEKAKEKSNRSIISIDVKSLILTIIVVAVMVMTGILK